MEALATENDLQRASVAAFEKLEPGEPWLQRARKAAFERFLETGLPTPKLEEWKYTSVAAIANTPFQAAAPRPLPVSPRALAEVAGQRERLVFVNGRWSPELSSVRAARPGLRVESLRETLRREPRRLESYWAAEEWSAGAFAALNTALSEDGAFVEVADGAVLVEPIHLVFLSEAAGGPTVSHPRAIILLGAKSQATIVEAYRGGAGVTLTNAVSQIVCGEGSVLDHYKVQREGLAGFHVHSIRIAAKRSSNVTSHNLALGAALARTDLTVVFAGEGGECTLNGLFVGGGSQHLDNHTVIDHAYPHCASRELYKGILDGRARGIFNGKIIVRPDAQKTDAMQTNKNLLLSREALVNSTPALEIFADDVKCKHGSTIGQLDAAALFYLRSRGLSEAEARSLLTYAFAADLAERIRVPAVRDEIQDFLGRQLGRPKESA